MTFVSLGLFLGAGSDRVNRWRFFTTGCQVGGARSKFKLGQVEKWPMNCKVSQC